MEYMRGLDDNAFDLAIVDPPYGMGNDSIRNGKTKTKLAKAGDHHSFDNSKAPSEEYFEQLKRVSLNQVIWGANHFCDRFKSNSSRWIVWNKHTGESCFSDCELAYTSLPGALRMLDYPWNGMIQGFHGDKSKNETRIHPTQKPVFLYSWVLNLCAKKGHKILDTHLGSGSSAIASHYSGFDFVGCEIDPIFYKSACSRFDNETLQLAMQL